MTRAAGLLGVAVAAWLAGAAWTRSQDTRHWLDARGEDWVRLSPEGREAWATGFLAGSGLAAALSAGGTDSASLSRALDSLRREGGFPFPYAPALYASRVQDYYWWENHRPLPIWFAFWDVNRTLQRSGGHADR